MVKKIIIRQIAELAGIKLNIFCELFLFIQPIYLLICENHGCRNDQ
jgi:hypothetical protein